MGKLKEYDQAIEVHAAEVDRVEDKLTSLDPTTDEYRKCAEALKLVSETKQTEIRSKNEYLNGKVPQWATAVFGSVLALGFGAAVMRFDQAGGMISQNAVNLWDKIIRKF